MVTNGENPGNYMQLERAQKGKQEQFMQAATPAELKKAINVAREIEQRERYNKIDFMILTPTS